MTKLTVQMLKTVKTSIGSSQFFLCFFLLFQTLLFAQEFEFQLTSTDETCTANGCLQFQAQFNGTTVSPVYTVYRLPDTTNHLTITSANSYCGLQAGTYRVIANISFEGQNYSQQKEVTITANFANLDFGLNAFSEGCGETAALVVMPISGTPSQYEITAGPVTRPLQNSPVFPGLASGTYTVRVFDTCGQAIVHSHTFATQTPGLSHISSPFFMATDCEMASWSQKVIATTFLAYPLTVTYTITGPDGSEINYTGTIASGGYTENDVIFDVELPIGPMFTYEITVRDNCGNEVSRSGEATAGRLSAQVSLVEATCAGNSYQVVGAQSASIVQAPELYPNQLPFVLTADAEGNFPTGFLTPGRYVFEVMVCDEIQTLPLVVTPLGNGPIISVQKGCEIGEASLFIRAIQGTSAAVLLEAPESYDVDLPLDLTGTINSGVIRLGDLPAGIYVFRITNTCNYTERVEINVEGFAYQNNTTVIRHCGTFDLDMQYSDNNSSAPELWLQKWNPLTGQWCHPLTMMPMADGEIDGSSAMQLINQAINYNFSITGQFRIVAGNWVYSADAPQVTCLLPVMEFEFDPAPVIENIYSVSCDDLRFDVVVEATGVAPLQYSIATYNGEIFHFDNGTSPLFTNLAPGIYNFVVTDACSNVSNAFFDTSQPVPFGITESGLCEGQIYELQAPNFPFLQYEWRKEGSNNVLSTNFNLQLNNYSATDLGTYTVTLIAPNTDSCLNRTLSEVVDTIELRPHSGNDLQLSRCSSEAINLQTLLSGIFDTDGIWTNASGETIAASVNLQPGVHQFFYTTSSSCHPDDVAEIEIEILAPIQAPTIAVDGDFCGTQAVTITAVAQEGTTLNWSGPNGFTSNENTLVFENLTAEQTGWYSVKANNESCESDEVQIWVERLSVPEFTILDNCQNEVKQLAVSVEGTTSFNINWSGPNGFTSNANPVSLLGQQPGEYRGEVVFENGCTSAQIIEVATTMCTIPKGVSPNGDAQNDNWDLSGFGENLKVKIFNRYGMCVYEMNNYANQWKGQDKKGNELPSATYYYVVTTAEGESKTGWVYLIRS